MSLDKLRKQAWAICEAASPTPYHPEAAGLLDAAATHAALRGTGARFSAGGAFLLDSQVQGWGVVINPAERSYLVTADAAVDAEDGSYCGHCWVELGVADPTVVDQMGGYVGPTKDVTKPLVYHRLATLTASVRAHHRATIAAVQKAAARDKAFCARVRKTVAL